MSEWHDRPSIHLHSVPIRPPGQFRPRDIYIALAAATAIVAIICAVIWQEKPAQSAADHAQVASTVRPTAAPAGAPTRRPVEKSPPVAEQMGADGTYLVGREIKTGTYSAPGGPKCYWARLRNTSGEMAAVIAASYHRGRQVATIGKGDRAFLTDGCGTWAMIP